MIFLPLGFPIKMLYTFLISDMRVSYLINLIVSDLITLIIFDGRSRWPRGLRHELSSLARTLGSWVRILLKAWMSVYAFILCLCCPVCIGSDLATG
jgi:hypothetical protein